MIWRLVLLSAVAASLAGCQTTGPASVKGGECRVFERPEYAIRGARQYDQDWVDSQIEGGVGACGWKRPAARPASLDAAPGQKVAPTFKAKKRGLIKRIKDRVVHPFTKPVAPIVESPPVASVPAPVVQAPPPRDPVDELLHPGGGR
jgi:hypothetical protein